MCLLTTQQEVKIAQEDITCYKLITPDMTSFFHTEFKWELGKLYETEMDYCPQPTCRINQVYQAFHSYETLQDLKHMYTMLLEPCLMVKCTIPKGSEYCSGTQTKMNGYASNKLIANEILDVKEVFNLFDWDNYPFKVGQKIKTYKGKTYQILSIQPNIDNQYSADLIVEDCDTSIYKVIKTEYKKGTWRPNPELKILEENKKS